jgi:hypothetical protein
VLAIPGLAAGADSNGDTTPPMEMRFTATFPLEDLEFGRRDGFDTVGLHDGEWVNEPGHPRLPAQTFRIAVPAGMRVTSLRIAESETIELEGAFDLIPAQPPRRTADRIGADDFVGPDADAYASTEIFPTERAVLCGQTDLAGQPMAIVRFHPLSYIPAEQTLTLHSSIKIVLEGVPDYVCLDHLSPNLSPRARARSERAVADLVANPDDVRLVTSDENAGPRDLGPGDYDYVIISDDAWADDFQPLADWKTKKGVPTNIVTMTYIYNYYSGSTTQKIRSFIQDAYATWGATFFLLGGDSDTIPTAHSYYVGDDIPNDTYYADYDGDWTCEVHVGRASVRTTSAIDTFIDKILTYEKNPPLSDYARCITLLGFDLSSWGSGEGEDLMKDVDTYYVPSSWTVRSEYDSEGGSHKTDSIGYLNQGNNLVNHADHSDTDVMGVGCTNHNQFLYNSDMTGLYNGDRQSVLYTLGCWACDFPDYECIGESFVRDTNGGGVAFVGNTRFGWYYPGSDDGLSFAYDRSFFKGLLYLQKYTLGEAFSYHKDDAYTNDDHYRYVYTELTLLGDPTLPIWSDDPAALDVTHDTELYANIPAYFTVEATSGGNPVSGATVCLMKEDDVYAVQDTGANGKTTFTINADTAGTLFVTVTGHDHLPYEGQAEVMDLFDCPCDVNGDDVVNVDDLFALLGAWGPCPGCAEDVNDDGVVNVDDLFMLLGDWGPCV